MPDEPNPAQKILGDFAPMLFEPTDEVLFGGVWERPGLSARSCSLITVTALAVAYRTEQLGNRLRRAPANGLSEDELVEAITHLAFHAEWPSAVTQLKDFVASQDNGQREAEQQSCVPPLRARAVGRLGSRHMDLYQPHRVDPGVPIEKTWEARAETAAAGKCRDIGLSPSPHREPSSARCGDRQAADPPSTTAQFKEDRKVSCEQQ
ncbi:aldo/keto reductase [Streptomyces sp. NPDC020951]|uniref:carboxymuconolactone decarboxylase family protein n=1 Tax=Streptomyces sp. NPDC020951 TaxID=3365104 RepID=UPI0037A4AD0F